MSKGTEIPQNMEKGLEEFVNFTETELNDLKKNLRDNENEYFLSYRPFLSMALQNKIDSYEFILDKFYKIFPGLDKKRRENKHE